jgi:hypothetical protein
LQKDESTDEVLSENESGDGAKWITEKIVEKGRQILDDSPPIRT